jgi:hypothetical protein
VRNSRPIDPIRKSLGDGVAAIFLPSESVLINIHRQNTGVRRKTFTQDHREAGEDAMKKFLLLEILLSTYTKN